MEGSAFGEILIVFALAQVCLVHCNCCNALETYLLSPQLTSFHPKISCTLAGIGMRKQFGERNLTLSSFNRFFFSLYLHRLPLSRIFCSFFGPRCPFQHIISVRLVSLLLSRIQFLHFHRFHKTNPFQVYQLEEIVYMELI